MNHKEHSILFYSLNLINPTQNAFGFPIHSLHPTQMNLTVYDYIMTCLQLHDASEWLDLKLTIQRQAYVL